MEAVLPALLPVVIFSVYPLLRGIYLGFTDAEPAATSTVDFNGLENYRELLDDDLFWGRSGSGWCGRSR